MIEGGFVDGQLCKMGMKTQSTNQKLNKVLFYFRQNTPQIA